MLNAFANLYQAYEELANNPTAGRRLGRGHVIQLTTAAGNANALHLARATLAAPAEGQRNFLVSAALESLFREVVALREAHELGQRRLELVLSRVRGRLPPSVRAEVCLATLLSLPCSRTSMFLNNHATTADNDTGTVAHRKTVDYRVSFYNG